MCRLPLESPQEPAQTHKKPKAEPKAEAKPVSVESVITAFLGDTANRVGGETQLGYRKYLVPFAARYGSRPAESLTVTEAEAYARKPEWSSTYRANVLSTLITAYRWADGRARSGTAADSGARRPAPSHRPRAAQPGACADPAPATVADSGARRPSDCGRALSLPQHRRRCRPRAARPPRRCRNRAGDRHRRLGRRPPLSPVPAARRLGRANQVR